MAEKLKFRCSDGVVIEADKKVMRFASNVVRDMIDVNPNIATIPLQDTSSYELTRVIDSCEDWLSMFRPFLGLNDMYDEFCAYLPFEKVVMSRVREACEDILESLIGGKIPIENAVKSQPEADKLAERTREGLKFDVGTFITRFTNQSFARFDWEAIKSMHKVAKYLDIRFLLVLTEALIREAPSTRFMQVVSPWVDYKDVEAYRSHHVEACRNLEVAVA